ncbi:hypothetical protein ED855_19935, partial [Acinetobacter baumannii]
VMFNFYTQAFLLCRKKSPLFLRGFFLQNYQISEVNLFNLSCLIFILKHFYYAEKKAPYF